MVRGTGTAGCGGWASGVAVMANDSLPDWEGERASLLPGVETGTTLATHAQVLRSAQEQVRERVPLRVVVICDWPCAMLVGVSGRLVVVASVSVSSLVTKILISSSIPAVRKPSTELLSSSATQEAQVEDFTIQMNRSLRRGKGRLRARAERSRRRGRLKVIPVEPAMSMTESNVAKSR